MENPWVRWADARPCNPKALYRWRAAPRMILGMELQPEWSEKLAMCGMGWEPAQLWPSFSSWNGYTRSVAKSLEWRVAFPHETEDYEVWNGLDLLPSPFTGKPPRISGNRQWIAAPAYMVNSLSIQSFLVASHCWTDARAMQTAWNTRTPLPESSP